MHCADLITKLPVHLDHLIVHAVQSPISIPATCNIESIIILLYTSSCARSARFAILVLEACCAHFVL